MNVTALFTSAGINIGVTAVFIFSYSVLRKQPGNVAIYFGRRLAEMHRHPRNTCINIERLVPSASWIVKAFETQESEFLSIAGLDAVVFLRSLVLSIRVFSIAAVMCIFIVLPMNYYGQDMHHKHIPYESLDVFTIENVKEGSKWLWVHCLALYIISISTCILLYFNDVDKIYGKCAQVKSAIADSSSVKARCGICGLTSGSRKLYSDELQQTPKVSCFELPDSFLTEKESGAAFIFFKTRYAAIVVSQVLQSSNPMLWVSELAPVPNDVYWSNLWIPYRQLWIRRIATVLASLVFVVLFFPPVTFVQGLSQLDNLQKVFPFLKGILKKKYVSQIVTGYFPSVILLLFLLIVPPIMMLFSAFEGSVSRSGRKKSASYKILYFIIWNVFFVNVLSGTVINQLYSLSSPKDIPTQLAKAVPRQATFFITYILTSGWASLSCEIVQPFALFCSLFSRFILRNEDDQATILSFPYHTEVPRVLLFGLLGFTCSILAPLLLPFLLVYFLLAYVVYRNQILNVYVSKYESGGQMWPIVHNTTIFSLLLMQIIALGVFGLKKSPVASGFTIPLLILTLLFNEYCRQRFHPVFTSYSAQDMIDMDREDELQGCMEEIHEQLPSAYSQFSACLQEPPMTDKEGSSCRIAEVRA